YGQNRSIHPNQDRIPLGGSAANTGDSQSATAAAQFLNQGEDDPGAASSDRMAEGHRTAVYVHLFIIPAENFSVSQGDGGEGFVHFEPIDLIQSEVLFFQQLLDGIGGSDQEIPGFHRHRRMTQNAGHRPSPQLFGLVRRRENQGTSSIGNSRCIAGRDRPILQKDRF